VRSKEGGRTKRERAGFPSPKKNNVGGLGRREGNISRGRSAQTIRRGSPRERGLALTEKKLEDRATGGGQKVVRKKRNAVFPFLGGKDHKTKAKPKSEGDRPGKGQGSTTRGS